MTGNCMTVLPMARIRSSQLFPCSKKDRQLGKQLMNRQEMSISNMNVNAVSLQLRICRWFCDESAERVAWRTTDESAKSTQTHLVRSYHCLTMLIRETCLPGEMPYSSSSSSRIGPSLKYASAEPEFTEKIRHARSGPERALLRV